MPVLHTRGAGLDVPQTRSWPVSSLLPPPGGLTKNGTRAVPRPPISFGCASGSKPTSGARGHRKPGRVLEPIVALLEGQRDIMVVHAHQRMIESTHADLSADLPPQGLLRPSVLPPSWQRTRRRAGMGSRHEPTRSRGPRSAGPVRRRPRLPALLTGAQTPEHRATVARGPMRSPRDPCVLALTGPVLLVDGAREAARCTSRGHGPAERRHRDAPSSLRGAAHALRGHPRSGTTPG
jgi:hypothetical protein